MVRFEAPRVASRGGGARPRGARARLPPPAVTFTARPRADVDLPFLRSVHALPQRSLSAMKNHDLVGFYASRDSAERAREELLNAGFDRDDVKVFANNGGETGGGFWDSIK